jgi:hypothetical protein
VAEQDALPLEDEPKDEPQKVEVDPAEIEALREAQKTLSAQLEAEKLERARLEGQMKAQPAPAAPEQQAQPRLTEAQLQAAVDEGTISQAQMNQEIARQMREDITKDVTADLEQKFSAREQLKSVNDQFSRYVKSHPDVLKEGTEDRRLVQEEISSLIELGHPYDKRTELIAMRTIFGPIDRVQETTRQRREAHQETGGAGEGAGGGSGSPAWQKGLRPSQVAQFKREIEKGLYDETSKEFLDITTRARTKNAAKGKAA